MYDSKKHGSTFAAECLRQRGKNVRTKEGKKAGSRSFGRNEGSASKGNKTKTKRSKTKQPKLTTADDLSRFSG